MVQSHIKSKLSLRAITLLSVALFVFVLELIFYYTPLNLGFVVSPIHTSSLSEPTLSYEYQKNETVADLNSDQLIYLKTNLSPHVYRYKLDLTTIPELAELAFVKEGYTSSLELWSTPDLSQIQTNKALRTAMSKANISGEIFLPKLNSQSFVAQPPKARKANNLTIICYLRLVGDLKQRLPSSYGLDLNLTEEYIGFSYDYQIGVDKLGKVQYVLPLSRVDAQMNKTLINALWQLPFEANLEAAANDIEWGRVKIEFDY